MANIQRAEHGFEEQKITEFLAQNRKIVLARVHEHPGKFETLTWTFVDKSSLVSTAIEY